MTRRATYIRPGTDLSQLDIWDGIGQSESPEAYRPIVEIRPVARHRRHDPFMSWHEVALYVAIIAVPFGATAVWVWSR